MSETRRITKTALAAGCAIALGTLLSACASGASSAKPPANTSSSAGSATVRGTAPMPSTSTGAGASPSDSTSTTAVTATRSASTTSAAPAPVASDFLTANQLPDDHTYGWSRSYITPVQVEEPLQPICGKALGTELNTSAWDARYPSPDGQDFGEETIHTYASASYAASRVAASYPTCPGLTVHTANGFAWRTTGDSDYPGTTHVLFANVGAKVAVVTVTVPKRDYDSALDAKLLQAMTQRLSGS